MKARRSGTVVRKQPRQARAQATVGAILEATVQILDREGLEAATMAHIAEVAGVSVGSIYQYYSHRDAILHALQDREINPKTSGISVPVKGSRVLGSVSMIWIASALTLDEAEHRYHQPLQTLAARIAEGAERRHTTSETES